MKLKGFSEVLGKLEKDGVPARLLKPIEDYVPGLAQRIRQNKDVHFSKVVSGLVTGMARPAAIRFVNSLQAATDHQTIILPNFKEWTGEEVIALRGLVYHESGHLEHTTPTNTGSVPKLVHALQQPLEDVRMENLVISQYPGARVVLNDVSFLIHTIGSISNPPSSSPFGCLSNYVLYAGRRRYRNQPVLQYQEHCAREAMVSMFGDAITAKVDTILEMLPLAASTKDARNIARELLALLHSELNDAENQPNEPDPQQSNNAGDSQDEDGDSGDSNNSSSDPDSESDSSSQQGSGTGDDDTDEDSDDTQASGSGSDDDSQDGDTSGQSGNSDEDGEDAAQSAGDSDADEGSPSNQSAGDSADGDDGDSSSPSAAQNDNDDGSQDAGSLEETTDANAKDSSNAAKAGDDSQSANSQASVSAEQLVNAITQTLREAEATDPAKHDLGEQILSEILEDAKADDRDMLKACFDPVHQSDQAGWEARLARADMYDLKPAKAVSSALRSRMQGLLESQRKTYCRHVDAGKRVSRKRLARTVVGETRVFQRKHTETAVNTAISVCLDASSSMTSDDRMVLAKQALAALMMGLDIPYVSYEAFSFSSTGMFPIVHFDERMDCAKARRRLTAATPSMYTPTHAAVLKGLADLLPRPEERKIIFVITDGDPDDSAAARCAISEARNAGVEVLGIGIRGERFIFSLFGREYARNVNNLEELPREMFAMLEQRLLAAA